MHGLDRVAPQQQTLDSGNPLGSTTEVLSATGDRLLERLLELLASLPLLGIALLVVGLFWLLSRWLGRSTLLFGRIRNPLLRELVRQISQTLVLMLGVLVGLEIMDAMALAGAVLGAAGVIGLAVGFAFKDVIENYLAGILLSMRRPFSADDLIVVEGYEGRVMRLTPRATILMTLDGNHVRLPNALVFKSPMTNYTRNPLRRFDFVIGVGGSEDLAAAQAVGLKQLQAVPGVLSDPAPSAALDQPGDFSVGVHFYAWIDQQKTSLPQTKSAAIRMLTEALAAAQIDMPEPTHRLKFDGVFPVAEGADRSEAAVVRRPERAEGRVPSVSPPKALNPEDDIKAQIARDRRLQGTQDDDLLRSDVPME